MRASQCLKTINSLKLSLVSIVYLAKIGSCHVQIAYLLFASYHALALSRMACHVRNHCKHDAFQLPCGFAPVWICMFKSSIPEETLCVTQAVVQITSI